MVRKAVFAHHDNNPMGLLIEAPIGSRALRRPPDGGDDLVAYEKLAIGMTRDWQAHDCRVKLRL